MFILALKKETDPNEKGDIAYFPMKPSHLFFSKCSKFQFPKHYWIMKTEFEL